jgi:hypothetical protein
MPVTATTTNPKIEPTGYTRHLIGVGIVTADQVGIVPRIPIRRRVDRLQQARRVVRAFPERPERAAEVVLRHRPVERHALARVFL